ncbi:hypothetical protein BLOT_005247 [Blomia tropicalis]|nr:hypothetical protein BLOT_005247 [Blomia tropicalis]
MGKREFAVNVINCLNNKISSTFMIRFDLEQVICHKKSIENLIKIKEANILNFVDFKAEFVEKNAKIKMELPR